MIAASENMEDHFTHPSWVFSQLAVAGLKIKLSKLSFLKRHIKFLGHTSDKDGIHISGDKVKAVSKFSTPTNTDQVHCFLGLSGYYR